VGAVGAEAVQQQAEVPPPGVGRAGGADRRQDAGIGSIQERQVLQGEVGAQLAALLGAVDHLGDHLEQAGLGGLHGGGAREPHPHNGQQLWPAMRYPAIKTPTKKATKKATMATKAA
jgi:hypothetical protein